MKKLLIFIVLAGCCSGQVPPPCPEVEMPPVVTEIVESPPRPLPLPTEPVLLLPDVDPDNVQAVVEAIYLDMGEYDRAFRECVDIIEANNQHSEPPDP